MNVCFFTRFSPPFFLLCLAVTHAYTVPFFNWNFVISFVRYRIVLALYLSIFYINSKHILYILNVIRFNFFFASSYCSTTISISDELTRRSREDIQGSIAGQ